MEAECRSAIKEIFRHGCGIPDGDTAEKRRILKVKFMSSKPANEILYTSVEEMRGESGNEIFL